MKVIGLQRASLERCVRRAREERVVFTLKGKPVALFVGVEGLDLDQIELGQSDEFRQLVRDRRRQKTLSRAKLETRQAER